MNNMNISSHLYIHQTRHQRLGFTSWVPCVVRFVGLSLSNKSTVVKLGKDCGSGLSKGLGLLLFPHHVDKNIIQKCHARRVPLPTTLKNQVKKMVFSTSYKCMCCQLNFVRPNVTTVPYRTHCFDLFRGRTWAAVWFLPHVCMLLIFLWSRISEVSDYVSIKHIHCPAINALIAAEKENVLGSFNNGVLFIRGHSDVEVGKPCNPSTL